MKKTILIITLSFGVTASGLALADSMMQFAYKDCSLLGNYAANVADTAKKFPEMESDMHHHMVEKYKNEGKTIPHKFQMAHRVALENKEHPELARTYARALCLDEYAQKFSGR